jgi:hypothetical protein
VLFENRFVRDESTAKEIYGYHFFKRPLMITLYVLIALNALLRSISFILGTLGPIDAFLTVILPLLIILLVFVAYRSQVKALVSRDAESAGGGEFFNELRVSDGDITITTPISSQSVGLDKMKYAFMTKGYICVVTKANLMYIFKKDSFSVGDGDSFLAFLREKGIKVKGKKTV